MEVDIDSKKFKYFARWYSTILDNTKWCKVTSDNELLSNKTVNYHEVMNIELEKIKGKRWRQINKTLCKQQPCLDHADSDIFLRSCIFLTNNLFRT